MVVTLAGSLALIWRPGTERRDGEAAGRVKPGQLANDLGGAPVTPLEPAQDHAPANSTAGSSLAGSGRQPIDGDAIDRMFFAALQKGDPDQRRRAIRGVAETLAENGDTTRAADFIAALRGVRDRAAESDAYSFTKIFADRLAARDAGVVATWAAELPEALRDVAYSFVARHWVGQDPQALSAWTSTIENPGLRATVIRATAHQLRNEDPRGVAPGWAAELARSVDGPRFSDLVAAHWAKTDFKSAAEWTATLAAPEAREAAYLALATTLGERDPQMAISWIPSVQAGELRNRMLQEALSSWATSNPAAAANWLDGQTTVPGLTEAVASRIASAWMQRDPVAAEKWVRSTPLKPEIQNYLLTLSAASRPDGR